MSFQTDNSVLPASPIPHFHFLGGMASLSMRHFYYQTWFRTIAHQGVCVFAIDFRNSMTPSSTGQPVAPYPAGLNDCVAGVHYLHATSEHHSIDTKRILLAGDSGGGNLTIATALRLQRTNELHLLCALYPMCPYIAGEWPQPEIYPSTIENEGILLQLGPGNKHGYGVDGFNKQDPCCWPSFAKEQDVADFPPIMVSVNECDPLRDEGIEFYRLCVRSGVEGAQCRVVVGTCHAGELLGGVPDIAKETARSIAAWTLGDEGFAMMRKRSRGQQQVVSKM